MRRPPRWLFAAIGPKRLCLAPRRCHCSSTAALATASSSFPSSTPPFTPLQLLADPSAATALPSRVVLPAYDRSALQPGIVHLGLGAFPRAHLAYYMDALLHTGHPSAAAWSIAGVGVRRDDRRVCEVLRRQDGLYTVVARGGAAGEVEVRVVGSVVEVIFAPDEPQRLLERLLSPHTRIVSLTATEGGYDSERNPEMDDDSSSYSRMQQHLTAAAAPDSRSSASTWPRSVFGWIVLGLDGRRRLGLPPYSVLSLDNVQLNGHVTKRSLLHIARHMAELSAHIRDSVSCPSSMVDRITPITTVEQAAMVRDVYGIDDDWPLLPEQWVQWVVEDEPAHMPFTAGRPPLELLAPSADTSPDPYHVLLVPDVAPYEHMKLRLLNASHSGICYLGSLCGYEFIHEVMADPLFCEHMRRFMDEASVTLPAVPHVDVEQYKSALVARFANPNIRDTVARVCQNGADKWPRFLTPTLHSHMQQATPDDEGALHCHHSALIIAAWLRYLDGADEKGRATAIVDSTAEQLGLLKLAAGNASSGGRSASAGRLMEAAGDAVFGDVWRNERFVGKVETALSSLYAVGARATLQQWLDTRGGRRGTDTATP